MPGRVVLFGATGYTGHLAAEAMVRRGLKPVLAGRDPAKLNNLAIRLGGLETAPADVDQPTSLADLLQPGDLLVTTVGPFTLYGQAAIEAAVAKGAHYVDTTGEPGFVRKVFEVYGPRAKAAGIALIPAGGYDYVPGNVAAAVALRAAGPKAVRVDVGYFSLGRFELSQGTLASTRAAMTEPDLMWQAGRWVEQMSGTRLRAFQVSGKDLLGLSISSSEHFSLPRLYPQLRDVNIYLGWFGKRSRALQRAAKVQSVLRKVPGVKALLRSMALRVPPSRGQGPDAETRSNAKSLILAECFDANGKLLARSEISGVNGYSFTAEMLTWFADAILKGMLKASGALGPVEAFGLEEVIEGCRQAGLELTTSAKSG
jgi:short subunit dehydrogenase-like uncharacterized protein